MSIKWGNKNTIKWFDSNNNFVLRVWFLWEDNMDKLEKFKEKFDIVLIWDWWMYEIIDILTQNI